MFYGEKDKRLENNIAVLSRLPSVLDVAEHTFIRSGYEWTKLQLTVHPPSFDPDNIVELLDENRLSSGGLPVSFRDGSTKIAQLLIENWWEDCLHTNSPEDEIQNTMKDIREDQRAKHPQEWIEAVFRTKKHPETDFGQTQYFAYSPVC